MSSVVNTDFQSIAVPILTGERRDVGCSIANLSVGVISHAQIVPSAFRAGEKSDPSCNVCPRIGTDLNRVCVLPVPSPGCPDFYRYPTVWSLKELHVCFPVEIEAQSDSALPPVATFHPHSIAIRFRHSLRQG